MDIKLHYSEKGSGEVLILLHGNNESGSYFLNQIDYFSGNYRVIAVDTRGHGNSPRGSAPFTIQQFALDLYGFMCEHMIEKAHILGFSDGGNIALCFALKHPEMVDKLVLNGANLNTRGVKGYAQIPINAGYFLVSLFACISSKAKKMSEMLGLMVKNFDTSPESLRGIQIQTLVIAGTKDLIKDSHTRLIHKSIPGSKLILLPGGHFIARKTPEAFNLAIDSFLRS